VCTIGTSGYGEIDEKTKRDCCSQLNHDHGRRRRVDQMTLDLCGYIARPMKCADYRVPVYPKTTTVGQGFLFSPLRRSPNR